MAGVDASTKQELPYGRQSIDETDIEAVVGALRSDRLTGGPLVEAFEKAFAERVGAHDAVACANGTAALHLAALALKLAPGDHVVVPAVTFLATANAVRLVGAEVIFADVDPDSGLMLPQHLEDALRRAKGLNVRAVFPVHLNGQCGEPAEMAAVARSHGLAIVEDACHALGTSYVVDDVSYPVGACAHADLTVFSFHPVKTITSGEGGMVTGNDPSLLGRAKLLRNHGMVRDPSEFLDARAAFEDGVANPWYYEMQEIGLNYRLSDIHCALGLSQLKKLEEFVAKRSTLVERYCRDLTQLAPSIHPIRHTPSCRAAWHLFVALFDFESLGMARGRLMERLAHEGIGTQVHYIPLYRQPYYRKRYGAISLPGAESYYRRCLSLPLHVDMHPEDVDRVVSSLESVRSWQKTI